MLENIPQELRAIPQWVAAGADGIPLDPKTKEVDRIGRPKRAEVDNPETWGTFEQAVGYGAPHVGFVLTKDDPYAIIDLDDKPTKPAPADEKRRHAQIVTQFDSYTEISRSGRGYHIVIRGRMPDDLGRRRGWVEAYSCGRYMIFTGDVVHGEAIEDRQYILDVMASQMEAEAPKRVELEDHESVVDDIELVEMARHATNGEKFEELCRLPAENLDAIQAAGYQSQSEADLALLSIFAFYTRDNEQVKRLFRYSNLGKRDKATRNDVYLNRTLQLIRSKEPPMIDFSQLQRPAVAPVQAHTPAPAPAVAVAAPVAPSGPASRLQLGGRLTRPPGLLGEIMDYTMSTVVRPVPEIALAVALGLMGGVCGRQFNISNVGLNQYITFIAKTGIGKEGIATATNRILSSVRQQVPMADSFIGPGAFASGQALIKVLDSKQCFVSILGEFGMLMQMINDPRASSTTIALKRVLLDLYTKSGWGQVLRSTVYSDQEKNTTDVHAPSVTIIGESTPEEFYTSIDASSIASGMIPRFSIIEYDGDRPPRNLNAGCAVPMVLANKIAALMTQVLTMANNESCCNIPMESKAQSILDKFDQECDNLINTANRNNEGAESQIWNRAHLKALKLAALVAVGLNFQTPIVTEECANWAISFVRNDAEILMSRVKLGDIGQGEVKQESEIRRIIEAYLHPDAPRQMKSLVDAGMHAAGVVPYDFIRRRGRTLACFKSAREGATAAMQATLKQLVDVEVLQMINPVQAKERFNTRAPLYALGKNW